MSDSKKTTKWGVKTVNKQKKYADLLKSGGQTETKSNDVFVANVQAAAQTLQIYVDSHQGKHIVDYWPGYKGQRDTTFLSTKVSYKQQTLFVLVAQNVPWAAVPGPPGADIFFSTDYDLSGDGHYYIWVQCGRGQSGGTTASFHMIPVTEVETKNASYLDVSTVYG
jgi:hypothetical protein